MRERSIHTNRTFRRAAIAGAAATTMLIGDTGSAK